MNSAISRPLDRSFWRPGLLLILSAAVFTVGLSDAPIERAEIYFLDVARAMLERSDLLVPYYRGEPFYDKPPLTYWLVALSFKVLGPSLLAGRLVAVALALATLGVTFSFVKHLIRPLESGATGHQGQDAAFFAVAILATSTAFVSFARLTMSDMLLTLLTLLAGHAFLKNETGSRPAWLAAGGAFLGLGFLTKGPIAWIYFLALLVAFMLVERRRPKIFTVSGLSGALVALGLGLSWFLVLYLRQGIEPLTWFFLRENLQRFAASTYDADRPWWYYGPVYAIEGLPWSVLLAPAIVFSFRASSPPILRVLLYWSMLMLVPLSLSRGKIDYYLLPLLPPLSIVIGAYLASGVPSRTTLRTLALLAAILLMAAAWFPMLPEPFSPPPLAVNGLHGFLLLASFSCVVAAIRPSARRIVAVCASSALGVAFFLFGAVVPAYRAAQPTDALLDHIARERVFTPDLEIAVCDDTLRLQRDILLTLRIPVREQCELWQVVSSRRKFLMIVTLPQEKSLRTADQVRHIASFNHLPADVTRLGALYAGARISKVGLLANFQTTDPVARWKRNREFKRWLDTPEGQRAEEEQLERERIVAEDRRRAGLP